MVTSSQHTLSNLFFALNSTMAICCQGSPVVLPDARGLVQGKN